METVVSIVSIVEFVAMVAVIAVMARTILVTARRLGDIEDRLDVYARLADARARGVHEKMLPTEKGEWPVSLTRDQGNEIIILLRRILLHLEPAAADYNASGAAQGASGDLRSVQFLYGGFALPLPKAAGSAKMVGPLPDPVATPGVWNPDVTDATITTTIAVPGWTKHIRPPVSYTDALKQQKMAEYGFSGDPANYELDHLIPLCCGGHPTDEQNLWPQPRTGLLGASVKDLTEVAAQHAIIGGVIHLDEIRYAFQRDWVALHARLLGDKRLTGLMMLIPPPEPEP